VEDLIMKNWIMFDDDKPNDEEDEDKD